MQLSLALHLRKSSRQPDHRQIYFYAHPVEAFDLITRFKNALIPSIRQLDELQTAWYSKAR